MVLRPENQKICERTTELESSISITEDALPSIKKDIQQIKVQIIEQAQRWDNLENRQRRNNVRILGFPEHEEGQVMTVFFEKWILDVLGTEGFLRLFTIERAHRILSRSPSMTKYPRTVTIK